MVLIKQLKYLHVVVRFAHFSGKPSALADCHSIKSMISALPRHSVAPTPVVNPTPYSVIWLH